MFKNAKIGDKVWDLRYGWGVIISICHKKMFLLKVEFTSMKYVISYTLEGKESLLQNINPILFWNEFEISPEAYTKPIPDLEVDTKLIVWDNDDDKRKLKRYFSHFDSEGRVYCFSNGTTSWSETTTTIWDNWELYKE